MVILVESHAVIETLVKASMPIPASPSEPVASLDMVHVGVYQNQLCF